MADIRDEFLARALELFEARQIVEYKNGSVALAITIENARAIDLQPALFWTCQPEIMLDGMFFCIQLINKARQFMQTQRFDNGLVMNVVRDAKKPGESAISQLDPPRLIKQEKALGHAVKESVLLRLELVERDKLNFLEFRDFSLRYLLRFNETTTPPEMQENQRCQSENC